MLTSFLLLAFTCFAGAAGQASSNQSVLSFHVTSGSNENYFVRDTVTSGQLLLTSPNASPSIPRRLVVALPAGNSGALTYFLPLNNTAPSLNVQLVNGTLRSTKRDYGNAGLQVDLSFSANATLGVTIIGAVRAMRDYVEGSGTMHEIFNYTLDSFNSSFVRLHRQWINSTADDPASFKSADLEFSVPEGSTAQFAVTPGNNGSWTPPTVNILTHGPDDFVRVAVVTNETSLEGLNTQALFLPANSNGTQGLQTALQGLADGTNAPARQVSFLTYADKFTAGGWRFLTYFGRDSMIALRLLMPLLTPEAIESALGAVIERANATGALCHEETIGDYASFISIVNNQSQLGNTPFYDYKMIDTDLLLLPALRHYLLELPQGKGRAPQFLARRATLQNGTYAEILNRNVLYNLGRAQPFAIKPAFTNLIGLRPGQPVGNWRDSNQGLGYGFYPFDVNTALVPASLRATSALLKAGIISGSGLKAQDVAAIANVWEAKAASLFDVHVKGRDADRYLKEFVQAANLSDALLPRSSVISGVDFYALSLMEDGTPVEVMNSDMGFNLVYGENVSRTFLQHVIDALQPYPTGLLTNVGMLVANPAYDSNRTNIEVLNRAAYQWDCRMQGLMASGLARQLNFCSVDDATAVDVTASLRARPAWCKDAAFVQSLRDAQTRLWTSIIGAGNEINTEVWSYSFNNKTAAFSVADLASLSPDGTESDAIQLWSYGFLGLVNPLTNKTVEHP